MLRYSSSVDAVHKQRTCKINTVVAEVKHQSNSNKEQKLDQTKGLKVMMNRLIYAGTTSPIKLAAINISVELNLTTTEARLLDS